MRIATLGGTASIEYSISVIPGRRFYPCRKHLFNYRDKRKSQRNQRDAAFPGADQPQCGRPDSSRRPGGSECVVLLHRHSRGKCRQPPLWVWGHGFAAQVLLLACCSQETMSAVGVFAAPMDLKRLGLTGPAMPIVDDMNSRPDSAAASVDFSRSGNLVYMPIAN